MQPTTPLRLTPVFPILLLGAALLVCGCATSRAGGSAADQRALADFIHSSTTESTVENAPEVAPVDVSSDEFGRAVLGAPLPVLVEFWAPWCQPCRRMLPALEQVAREYSGRLRVARVNIDDAPIWAQRYRIHEIPALLVFNDGQLLRRRVGALPASDLRMYLEGSTAEQPSVSQIAASAGLR